MSKAEAYGPAQRYVKGERIGHGAYKTVFKAIDREKGMEVAWNEIQLDGEVDLKKLSQEIELLGQLECENIMQFFESWVDEDKMVLIFITELMTSGSLRSFLQKAKSVAIPVIRDWCRQILEGLHYLHTRQPTVVHRDIKLDNIFFHGTQGRVKIGDLGLATVVNTTNSRLSVIGTPGFMAPEFYYEQYNEKVDIWAFGLALIEMTTLDYPYSECTNIASIYRAVSTGMKPAALIRVKDARLFEFICCCVEFDVAERFSAAELLTHPWLTFEDEKEPKFVPLATEEEYKSTLASIGNSPVGWTKYIQGVVGPIRSSPGYPRRNVAPHAPPQPPPVTATPVFNSHIIPVADTPLRDDSPTQTVQQLHPLHAVVTPTVTSSAPVYPSPSVTLTTPVQVSTSLPRETQMAPVNTAASLPATPPKLGATLTSVGLLSGSSGNGDELIESTPQHSHSLSTSFHTPSSDIVIATPMPNRTKTLLASSSTSPPDEIIGNPLIARSITPELTAAASAASSPPASNPPSTPGTPLQAAKQSPSRMVKSQDDDEILNDLSAHAQEDVSSEDEVIQSEPLHSEDEGGENDASDLEEDHDVLIDSGTTPRIDRHPSGDQILLLPSPKKKRPSNLRKRVRTRSVSHDDEVILETLAPALHTPSPLAAAARAGQSQLDLKEDRDDELILSTTPPQTPQKGSPSPALRVTLEETANPSAPPPLPGQIDFQVNLAIAALSLDRTYQMRYDLNVDTPLKVAAELVLHLNIPTEYSDQIAAQIQRQIYVFTLNRRGTSSPQASPRRPSEGPPPSPAPADPRLSLPDLTAHYVQVESVPNPNRLSAPPQSASLPVPMRRSAYAKSRRKAETAVHPGDDADVVLEDAPQHSILHHHSRHMSMEVLTGDPIMALDSSKPSRASLEFDRAAIKNSLDRMRTGDLVPGHHGSEDIGGLPSHNRRRLVPPTPAPSMEEDVLRAAHEMERQQLADMRRQLELKHARELEALEVQQRQLEARATPASPATPPSPAPPSTPATSPIPIPIPALSLAPTYEGGSSNSSVSDFTSPRRRALMEDFKDADVVIRSNTPGLPFSASPQKKATSLTKPLNIQALKSGVNLQSKLSASVPAYPVEWANKWQGPPSHLLSTPNHESTNGSTDHHKLSTLNEDATPPTTMTSSAPVFGFSLGLTPITAMTGEHLNAAEREVTHNADGLTPDQEDFLASMRIPPPKQ